MGFKLKQTLWTAAIFIGAVFIWRLSIPDLAQFEAPGWDEADRAGDAFAVFQGLLHFNPLPFLKQLVFFETWGPLYAVFAQVPLLLFGASARSLTFVSFFAPFVGSFFALLFLQRRVGWISSLAICVFAFTTFLSASDFAPYWTIFMTDSWSVAGWMLVALAGVCGEVDLLIAACWILFGFKYQYYPVFFVTFAFYFLFTSRKILLDFSREFLKPTWARAVFGLACIGVLHVVIMRVFGAVYGSESWTQPRALRNPVHVSFILATILVFVQRREIYQWIVKREWEQRFVNWFFWPATVLMAFPWPNRWAGVMVTQDYRTESHSLIEMFRIYSRDLANSLSFPGPMTAALAMLAVAFSMAVVVRNRRRWSTATLPALVALLFIVHILVLLAGVKNTQVRFAMAAFLSLPVGFFAYVLSSLPARARVVAGSAAIFGCALLLATPSFFSPGDYFTKGLELYANPTFKTNPELYPLDASLGPLVKEASSKLSGRPVHLGLLAPRTRELWDRTMRLWPYEFEAHQGVVTIVTIYAENEKYCEQSRSDSVELLVRPSGNHWETVSCEPH